ncbi:MAG TPA: hypothetical protein VG291_14700 [Xanthobacteraceae bacterium]|jgi:hypothetical protein|nr:hypothetical protein [Xanthobacteraceae bacterium]
MREWIGYLVACGGAEQTAARTAVDIPRRYLCGEDRAYRAHAFIDDASIGADAAFAGIGFAGIGFAGLALDGIDVSENVSAVCVPTDGVRTGFPITIIYPREKSADGAIEAIAGALAGFGVFDWGSQECPATGTGARRM